MRRLNLTSSLTIAGDATTGSIAYSGFTSPTITEIGDNPDVSVATDGTFTVAALGDTSEVIAVRVEKDGYAIEGPVTITGDGTGVEYARLGINLASITSYGGNYPFSNVMANAYPWARRATSGGSGSWTQHQGSLAATVSTDQFVTHFSDSGTGWVSGTYRVFNPDGCWIAFGYGADSPGTYVNTSPYFDVSLSPTGGNGVYMFVKGSLTNIAGPLKVVRPGLYDTNGETDTFTPEFITFMQTLNAGPLRFMDWTCASQNIETDWADRTSPTSISFNNEHGRMARVVPWEYCIELANRLGKDPWLCIPPMATQDYVDQFAALVDAQLDPSLRAWIELGNEIWNSDAPWVEGYAWVTYLDHTKRTAVANGVADTFTLAGHGLVEDQAIHCFSTPENLVLGLTFSGSPTYRMNIGSPAYIKYVDADTFQLKDAVGGSTISVYDAQVNLLFIVDNEAGKVANRNEHYAELCVRNWDAFDAAMGVGRVKHVVASQSSTPSVTTAIFARLTALSADTRADCIATAPYYNGLWMGGQVVTASGQFTPKVWSLYSGTFYWGVYASGATPTMAEIIAGTGAIASYTQSYTAGSSWSAGTAMTGVTNGVSYEIYLVRITGGAHFKMHATVTASASTTTTTITDSYANQAIRLLLYAKDTQATAHIAASGGKELVAYEVGADFNTTMPTELLTWTGQFYESAEAGDAYAKAMHIRATVPTATLCYFADTGTNGTTGYAAPFSMANTYNDITDERFLALSALNGRVQIRTDLTVADVTASDINSDPGSYPYTAHTFADSSLTYTIIGGNEEENFDISGGTLRIVAGNSIDWGTLTSYSLLVFATDGYTVDTFNVGVTTGAIAITDPDVIALLARYSVTPSVTFQSLLHNAITAMKAATLWNTRFDAFYLFANQNATDARLNIITNAYNCSSNGTLTFTAFEGFTGNGVDGYLGSGFTPSTASSPKYTQNSASMGAWCLSESTTAGYLFGHVGASNMTLNPRHSSFSNLIRANINSTAGPDSFSDATTSIGMFTLSRTGSGTVAAYRNKTAYGTSTRASNVVPAGEVTFLRANTAYSSHQIALGWIANGLTSGEKDTLYDIWQPLLSAVGAV